MVQYRKRHGVLTNLLAEITGVAPDWCAVPGRFSELNGQRDPGHKYRNRGGLGDYAELGHAVWNQTASNEYWQAAGPAVTTAGFQVFTAFALHSFNALTNARLLSNRQRTGSETSYFEVVRYTTDVQSLAINRSTTIQNLCFSISDATFYDGNPHSVAVRWDGSNAASYNFDGTALSVNSFDTNEGSGSFLTGSRNDICVGNIGVGTTELGRGPLGSYYLAAYWDTRPNLDTVAVLAGAWRDVLREALRPRRIWVPQTAAATVPTLSLPTYVPGSITTTGFTGRVTAT